MSRFVSLTAPILVVLLTLAIAVAAPVPARAQATEDTAGPATEEPLTRKERRQQAKQARIDRYLAKKEAKRERKAAEAAEREAAAAAQAQAEAQAASEPMAAASATDPAAGTTATAAAATAATVAATSEPSPKSAWGRRKTAQQAPSGDTARAAAAGAVPSGAPGQLLEPQARLRRGPIGDDPEAAAYMDRIDAGSATTTDIGEMANLLARRGYLGDAITYYRTALDGDPTHQSLLLNLGSVHLGRGELGAAERTFRRLLSIDPNHAYAHYNLGAVHQAAGKYDDAVWEFGAALILDPSLGDPAVNPPAAVNELMVPVKLMLYERQLGGKSLPLQDIQEDAGPIE